MLNNKLSNGALLQLAVIITNSYNYRETNIDADVEKPISFQLVLDQLTKANNQGLQHLYEALEDYGSGVITDALYWEVADLVNALANRE
ncbi:MAG: hypothetical protein RSC49_04680 [Clostridium sp.]